MLGVAVKVVVRMVEAGGWTLGALSERPTRSGACEVTSPVAEPFSNLWI